MSIADQATQIAPTAAAFARWLKQAKPGDWCTYACGRSLAEAGAGGAHGAGAAARMAGLDGRVHLVQERAPEGQGRYRYLAQRAAS